MNKRLFWMFWIVLAVVIAIRALTLGSLSLTDPSEGRYASIAQEMVISGDWVTARTYKDSDLIPFSGKPPLHTWLTALSLKYWGMNEVGARLPSFVASLGTLSLTFLAAFTLFGIEAAFVSIFVLLSSVLFFFLSGACLSDPLLCFSITLVICSWIRCMKGLQAGSRQLRYWGYLFFIGLATGMMTKGPIAIVLSIGTIAPYLLISTRSIKKSFQIFQNLPWVGGTAVFFLLTLPWFYMAEQASPGFLNYFFVHENFLRFLVKDYGDRYGSSHVLPYGSVWLLLLIAFLPWSLLFPVIIWKGFRGKVYRLIFTGRLNAVQQNLLLVSCWGLAPIVFFTPAHQISVSYVLPGIPGVSIVLGFLICRYATTWLSFLPTYIRWVQRAFVTGAFALIVISLAWNIPSDNILWALAIGIVCWGAYRRIQTVRTVGDPVSSAAKGAVCIAGSFAIALAVVGPYINDLVSPEELIVRIEESKFLKNTDIGFLRKVPQSAFFYANNELKQKANREEPFRAVSPKEASGSKYPFVAGANKDINKLISSHPGVFELDETDGGWSLAKRTAQEEDEAK